MAWNTQITDVATGLKLERSTIDGSYRVVLGPTVVCHGDRQHCRYIFYKEAAKGGTSVREGRQKTSRVSGNSKADNYSTSITSLRVIEHDPQAHSYWLVVHSGKRKEEIEWHVGYLLTECLERLGFESSGVKIEGDSDVLQGFRAHPTMDLVAQE